MKDFLQSAILLCCGVFGLILIVGTNREQLLGEDHNRDESPIIVRTLATHTEDDKDLEVWHIVKTEKLTIAKDSLHWAGNQ